MRRRSRSGHRMMLRGKPGVIVLGLFLFLGVFIAYYVWNSGTSVPEKKSRFGDKFVFPGRNSGPKYDQRKPQLEDPRNVQNMQKGADPFVGARKMKPLEPAAQFGGRPNEFRTNMDDDYDFKSRSFDDDDFKDDKYDNFKEEPKDDPRKSFTMKSEEEKEDQRARFQKFEEEKKDSAPDPKTVEEFRKMEHLVHIDLKGAPPKMNYLIGLFPLLRKLGATGLLMEYEDMFPYSGNLQIIAANNAYTNEEITRLLAAAKSNGLKVIPLIQTFGHMEFVLKYSKFQNLRESADTPQVISPVSEGSYTLINSMIDQVLALHPDTPYLHIGCDEVYELGKGRSVDVMKTQNLTKHHMFISHVKKVAGQVKTKYPKTKVIMWDDELRYTSEKDIQKSGLGDLVELMVWCYLPNIKDRISMDIFQKYSKYFNSLWAASSFKGATGSNQFFTNISYHLQNHLNWIQLVKDLKALVPETKFRGFAMTGWQRYDHFAILCELLPSSIPSLAVNLQAIQNGGISKEIHETVRKLLNCSNPLELDAPKDISQDCRFPGSDFYYGVQELWKDLSMYYNDLGLQSRMQGWLTEYHVRTHFSSPGQMKVLGKKLSKIVDALQSIEKPLRTSLLKIYGDETVEEWVQTHVVEIKNDLKVKLEKVTSLLKGDKVWNKRPSASVLAKQIQNHFASPQNVGIQKQTGMKINGQQQINQLRWGQKEGVRNNQFIQDQSQQTGLFGQNRQNVLQQSKQGLFGQAQFNRSSSVLNPNGKTFENFQQGQHGGLLKNQDQPWGALQNLGQPQGILQNQGRAQGVLQNQGRPQGVLQNQGQSRGVLQNQGQSQGMLQNQGRPQGVFQNQSRSQGVLQNQGRPQGVFQNQSRSQGVLQNQGLSRGVLQNQGQQGGVLQNQGQQGQLLPNPNQFKGVPVLNEDVRQKLGRMFSQKKADDQGLSGNMNEKRQKTNSPSKGDNLRDLSPNGRSKSLEGFEQGNGEKLIQGKDGRERTASEKRTGEDPNGKRLLLNAAEKDKFESDGKQGKNNDAKYTKKENQREGQTSKEVLQRKEGLDTIDADDDDNLRNKQIRDFDQDMAGHKHSKTDKQVPVNDDEGEQDHDIGGMRRANLGKQISMKEDIDKLMLNKGDISEENKKGLALEDPDVMDNKIVNSAERDARSFKNPQIEREKLTDQYDDIDDNDPKRGFKNIN